MGKLKRIFGNTVYKLRKSQSTTDLPGIWVAKLEDPFTVPFSSSNSASVATDDSVLGSPGWTAELVGISPVERKYFGWSTERWLEAPAKQSPVSSVRAH